MQTLESLRRLVTFNEWANRRMLALRTVPAPQHKDTAASRLSDNNPSSSIGSFTDVEAMAMAEEIEQNHYVDRVEWPLLALTAVIFIIAEELIRHFAVSGSLEGFICCCFAFTISRFTSEKSEGIARDALQAVSIASAGFLAFALLVPKLENFMPTFAAYGLAIFLMIIAIYPYVRRRLRQTSI